MSVATYTKSGAKSKTEAKLPENVFAETIESHQLLKDVYVAYQANGRSSVAHTKGKGEVRGGGKKPWKQKGTGRARHGSIRSPIWRGGGITFGPSDNPQNFSKKINKQAKRKALRQALTLAVKSDIVSVIDDFEIKDGKTKEMSDLLNKLGCTRATLLVVDNFNDMLVRSTNNIPFATLKQANYLNVFEVMNAHNIVFTKKAVEVIEAMFAGDEK